MSLKPFKFLVQTVILEVDEDGSPIGERITEQPTVLYGIQALKDFAEGLEQKVEAMNAAESNGVPYVDVERQA